MSRGRLFLRHVSALVHKECRQIIRDRSALLLGLVLPLVLIVLFGYGLSFDIAHVRIGVVDMQRSAMSQSVVAALRANTLFETVQFDARPMAHRALQTFEVEALLVLDRDAASLPMAQVLVNGIDAPRASMVANAISASVALAQVKAGQPATGAQVVSRVWFNESLESRWTLVPGLFVIVITLIGCMLTGLVVAREWERGTMEALLATPISPLAFLLSKSVPYFVLGMGGWAMCLGAALFLYGVPVRGSLTVVLAASALYLLLSLGIGLVISATTRSQFVSAQMTVLVSFLPAVILSGFIFDLRCAPHWADVLAHALPPVYYLELLKIGFLTGGMTETVIRNFAMLGLFTVVAFALAWRQCQKRIRR